jgi:UDP-glucuronate decarboxylase
MIKLMNSRDDFTGPVNVGNPNEFTIIELAQKIIELTGSKSKLLINRYRQTIYAQSIFL